MNAHINLFYHDLFYLTERTKLVPSADAVGLSTALQIFRAFSPQDFQFVVAGGKTWKKMGDEVKTIQQGVQKTCISEQFGYAERDVPVLADPVIASSHGIGPVDIVVRDNDLTDYCVTIVDTNRTNHSSDSSNSITNPISDHGDRICVNKHVNPIEMGPSRPENHRADTHVVQSEIQEETINRDTKGTDECDQSVSSIHQTIPVAMNMEILEKTNTDTASICEGQQKSSNSIAETENEEETINIDAKRTDECDQSVSSKHQTIPVAMNMEILETNTDTASICEGQRKSGNSIAESEHKEETIIPCGERDNMKHEVLPVAAKENVEINISTVGTSSDAGGRLDPEVTSLNINNNVTNTSCPEDIADDDDAPKNSEVSHIHVTKAESNPPVCQPSYPESVREVSALLQRARCSSPPQTSPPQPAPQLAAVAVSCTHSCGSLYAQCAANNNEPVSLNEILTEREHLPSYYRYHLDAVDYQSLDPLEEDEDTVLRDYHKQQQRFLMGNGVSSSPCAATSDTAVTTGSLQYAENGHPQKASPGGYTNVFRMSQPEDYDYLKGLVPQLKMEAKNWEAKSDSLETEVLELRRELKMREQEVVRLQREVHKLKVGDGRIWPVVVILLQCARAKGRLAAIWLQGGNSRGGGGCRAAGPPPLPPRQLKILKTHILWTR